MVARWFGDGPKILVNKCVLEKSSSNKENGVSDSFEIFQDNLCKSLYTIMMLVKPKHRTNNTNKHMTELTFTTLNKLSWKSLYIIRFASVRKQIEYLQEFN